MDIFESSISTLSISVWLVIAVAMLIAELETCTFSFLWFFISAIVTLVLSFLGVTPLYQIITFVSLSCFLFFVIGKYIVKPPEAKVIKTNIDAYIGKEVEIINIINKKSYEIKLEGKIWTATTEKDIEYNVGDIVSIAEVVGNKLVIKEVVGITLINK